MLQHISETEIMCRFSGGKKSPPRMASTNATNVIPFPVPRLSAKSGSTSLVIIDWRERPITQRQFHYIRLLAEMNDISIALLNDRCFRQFGADLSSMRRPQASDVIQALKTKYQHTKSLLRANL